MSSLRYSNTNANARLDLAQMNDAGDANQLQ
jgi:hypothetical protein